MGHAGIVRARATKKGPLIDNELPPPHGAQIRGAEASASSATEKDGVELPIIVGMKIEDRGMARTVEQTLDACPHSSIVGC